MLYEVITGLDYGHVLWFAHTASGTDDDLGLGQIDALGLGRLIPGTLDLTGCIGIHIDHRGGAGRIILQTKGTGLQGENGRLRCRLDLASQLGIAHRHHRQPILDRNDLGDLRGLQGDRQPRCQISYNFV